MRNSGSAATYAFHSSRRIGADSLWLHSDARVIWKSYPIDTSGYRVPCFRGRSLAGSFPFNLLRPRKHAKLHRSSHCLTCFRGLCAPFRKSRASPYANEAWHAAFVRTYTTFAILGNSRSRLAILARRRENGVQYL